MTIAITVLRDYRVAQLTLNQLSGIEEDV